MEILLDLDQAAEVLLVEPFRWKAVVLAKRLITSQRASISWTSWLLDGPPPTTIASKDSAGAAEKLMAHDPVLETRRASLRG